MNTFLKHLLLIGLLFFSIDKGSYFVLETTKSLQSDTRLEQLIQGNINKEVIVLGSSRGAGNILAGQLGEQINKTSYNLSYQGSNVQFHTFLVETLLKYNNAPEKIIYVIDNPYFFNNESTLKFRYDALYPLANSNYINDVLIDTNKHSWVSRYVYAARLKPKQFRFKKSFTPTINKIDTYGSQPIISKTPKKDFQFNHEVSDYDQSKELPALIDSFNKFQAICKSAAIEVIYVFTPNFSTFNEVFFERFIKIKYPETKTMIYNEKDKRYRDSSYFYDVSHLNAKGARVFTTEISNYLNNLEE